MGKPVQTIVIFFFFFFFINYSYSQAFNDIEWYDVDSLIHVLPDQIEHNRLNTLNALAASLSFEDKVKCQFYASQALSLAEELEDNEGIAAAYRNFGRSEFYDGNYPKALEYFQESLNLYEIQDNKYFVAQLLEDLATTHFFARNLDKAFELIHEALAVFRSKDKEGNTIGNARDTMTTYSRVGLPYRMIGRSDISKNIYLNYIILGKEHNFEITDMMLHHGLLAMCYFEIGNSDSAFYYFDQAAKYPDVNLSIPALKREHMRRMAIIHLKLGHTDTATLLLKNAFQWFAKRGFLLQSQKASKQLGDIYLNYEMLDSAKFYYYKSEELLSEMIRNGSYYRYDTMKYIVSYGHELYIPFTRKEMKEAIYQQAIVLYDSIYSLFTRKNQIQMANKYLIFCSDAKDTLTLIQRNRETIEIQTRYESERKDAEILTLSQQNQLNELQLSQTRWFIFGLIGLVVLIILFALVLIRQNQLRNSQQTLLFQQRLFRTQMNPHFIFNSLSSIQHLVVNEDPEKASIYLAKFSTLVRSVLYSSNKDLITIDNELKTIESYLALQKIRFSKKFEYKIDVDPQIDTESLTIPPMLAQPFIENAIEHGIKHKKDHGNIFIRFGLTDGSIHLEVEDDGVGRAKARELEKEMKKDHQSMATKITEERLRIINKKRKQKISLTITDLKDKSENPTGTKVSIVLPIDVA